MSLFSKESAGTPKGQTKKKEAPTAVEVTDVKQVQAKKEGKGSQNSFKTCLIKNLRCLIMSAVPRSSVGFGH